MKHPTTWVLVADAGSAKAYATVDRGRSLAAVEGFAFEQELPRTSEIMADGPTSVQESANAARHSVSLPSDPRRELKRSFARRLAEELDRRLAARSFDRLVMIAPPAFLGDLRAEATAKLAAATVAQIDKDLTKSETALISRHVAEALGGPASD